VSTGDSPFDDRQHALNQRADAAHALIDHNFSYHKPTDDQVNTIRTMREKFRLLAHYIVEFVPEGQDRSMALSKLDESIMHTNAAIVRAKEESDD
jgi:hypothetical protein